MAGILTALLTQGFGFFHLVAAIFGAYFSYHTVLILYRLSPFHPLARFPGPRISHATQWYRTYYEVFKGGVMSKQLKKLHEVYGPIVRFGPNDLCFNEPAAFHTIHSPALGLTKEPWLYNSFQQPGSSFAATDPQHAKERRAILSPFFARHNIISLEYVIKSKLDLFCKNLSNLDPTDVVDLSFATRSLAMDIIMDFCFASDMGFISYPGFFHPVLVSAEASLRLFRVFKHFPILRKIIPWAPNWLITRNVKGFLMLRKFLTNQIDMFIDHPKSLEDVSHPVVLQRLLDPNVKGARGPLTRSALLCESQGLFLAGGNAVGNVVSVGTYHILNHPEVYQRLLEELRENWPLLEEMPKYEKLEKLPYFSAVIKECLRAVPGIVIPASRVVPKGGVAINGEKIPPGTVVGIPAQFVDQNPAIFAHPEVFDPNRWLNGDSAGLEKWVIQFGRGTRMCLGIHLGWCELYMTFAALFRKFEMELFDTTEKDVDYYENFSPRLMGSVKVRMTPRVD